MRSAIVLALMLIVMAGTRYGVSSPGLHDRIAAADGSAIGSIIIGLIMLSPLFGAFFLFRKAFAWQRQFHRRMSSEGAWRSGNRS